MCSQLVARFQGKQSSFSNLAASLEFSSVDVFWDECFLCQSSIVPTCLHSSCSNTLFSVSSWNPRKAVLVAVSGIQFPQSTSSPLLNPILLTCSLTLFPSVICCHFTTSCCCCCCCCSAHLTICAAVYDRQCVSVCCVYV